MKKSILLSLIFGLGILFSVPKAEANWQETIQKHLAENCMIYGPIGFLLIGIGNQILAERERSFILSRNTVLEYLKARDFKNIADDYQTNRKYIGNILTTLGIATPLVTYISALFWYSKRLQETTSKLEIPQLIDSLKKLINAAQRLS